MVVKRKRTAREKEEEKVPTPASPAQVAGREAKKIRERAGSEFISEREKAKAQLPADLTQGQREQQAQAILAQRRQVELQPQVQAGKLQQVTQESQGLIQQVGKAPIPSEDVSSQENFKAVNAGSLVSDFLTGQSIQEAAGGKLINFGAGGLIGGFAKALGAPALAGTAAVTITRFISGSQKQAALEATSRFDEARGNMESVISDLNAGRTTPQRAVQIFNQNIAHINKSEKELSILANGSINEFLSKSGEQLGEVYMYKYEGGLESDKAAMVQAINKFYGLNQNVKGGTENE